MEGRGTEVENNAGYAWLHSHNLEHIVQTMYANNTERIMKADNEKLEGYLDGCEFTKFFVSGLGYAKCEGGNIPIKTSKKDYSLKPIAREGCCVVFTCYCKEDNNFPQTPILREIVRQVEAQEGIFLIIFTYPSGKSQLWKSNQPAGHVHLYGPEGKLVTILKTD